ncbi:glycosyltransferase family 2 protein [Tannerella sp.]|uniref:glycosyltransferase family 2 protein n=1 Tax=Tannerella sp. TaxID=2382127 RepID=UPI0026DAADAD|nr:glycosyltransferase family 2 protein [Tannerella sp.]MDO4704528.1 glycosyltransferase family 2 protein [Tannerella sp.]
MKKVSVLIPAYNEQESLLMLYERLRILMDTHIEYVWEVVFVNDGSRDHTLLLLAQLHEKDARINYVDLSRNYGKEVAMLAGFDYVKGDCMVIMDADLQHPPELIPEMLRYWEEGYDDVYARRRTNEKESFLRKNLRRIFYATLRKAAHMPIQQDTGDFRLLDRICIQAMKQLRESQRYTKGMFSWIGFRKKELLFDQQCRVAGESKWNFLKLLNLAVEGLTSFTVAPLRIASVSGAVVSLLAFIYGIYIFVSNLIYDDPVDGFPTIMVTILFLGGMQLLCIGIIGEYLGRIFNETKKRPVYFARSYNGQKIG